MGNLEELGGANTPELSHIKEQSPVFPEDLYKERWVREGSVENLRMKKGFQNGQTSNVRIQVPAVLRRLL